MNPYPDRCLICGEQIKSGIDAHIRFTHKMDYGEYCKWFYDAEGSYSLYKEESGRLVLTITRPLRPK